MKNKVRWMLMLVVVLALVAPNVKADWDLSAGLKFNMDFEDSNNLDHYTQDSELGLRGGVWDYNTGTPDCCNIFETTGKIGWDANFADRFDVVTGTAIGDCRIIVPNSIQGAVVAGGFYGGDSNLATVGASTMKRTWAFWFNPMKNNQSGTFLRHAYYNTAVSAGKDSWWEIRLSGGKLQFTQKNDYAGNGQSLDFSTVQSVSELSIDINEWHHAAFVIDRETVQEKCKIFVDGLEAPLNFGAFDNDPFIDATVDPYNESPLQIGRGQSQFDGRLDEIRLYHRALGAVEVSILCQSDGEEHPIALLPIPRSTNVSLVTDVNWIPTTGTCDSQRVWFGTDSGNMTKVKEDDGSDLTEVLLADLNGGNPLDFNVTYYWRVDANNGGSYVPGPNWYFTTGTGKAYDPDPNDGEEFVDGTYKIADINLAWKGLATVSNYSVYASTDQSFATAVQSKIGVAATASDGITVGEVNILAPERNVVVYWRVDCNYTSGIVTGDVWDFRTRPYEIIFNTRPVSISYQDHTFGPNSVLVHGNSWFALRADGNSTNQPSEVNVLGKVEGTGPNSVLVFDFNTFDYDRRFDIVVVPTYRPSDVNATNPIRPIAIHVKYAKPGLNEGCFKFDGRMNISGMDVTFGTDSEDELRARCGGFPGPKRNSGTSSPLGSGGAASDYWTSYNVPAGNYTRFGTIVSDKIVMVPTALAYSLWGPGQPDNPPYKGGGGGGYGGLGGDCGRGYWAGTFCGGKSYGDEEIPVPFGGSSGGWGGTESPGGCSGGGGIEIVADVNLTLDTNSVINANGGGSVTASGYRYPNGGGAGGSVRLIGNKVVIKGAITAEGGQGGNGVPEGSSGGGEDDTGGGGAGGRVAVFYGAGGYSKPGTVSVAGGQAGIAVATNTTLSENGQDGTFLVTNGSPEKASAPTPRHNDTMVYAPVANTQLTLKWYAGYNAASDEVYFNTFSPPTTKIGASVTTPTRGQRAATATVLIDPNKTYYFQVKTDGSTLSDVWKFKTVDWKCQYISAGDAGHVKGPEWDSNGDCVLNDADLWAFAQYWRDTDRSVDNTLDGSDLYRFLLFWLDCFNRTDNGCSDHLW